MAINYAAYKAIASGRIHNCRDLLVELARVVENLEMRIFSGK